MEPFMELIKCIVDRVFDEAPDRHSPFERTNPITGGRWVPIEDPIEDQKEAAYRALRARLWFRQNGPPDAPLLPLSPQERQRLKAGGLPHIVAWFEESLVRLDYAFDEHPSFEDYARGVMACPDTPAFIRSDAELSRRFPPRPLAGLNSASLVWRRPK
jgi:hypothetical protein